MTDPPETAPDQPVPPSTEVTIVPRADGPLLVEGQVRLIDPDGRITEADRLFLCRCGRSGTKPLCDGSHKRAGFEAPGVAPTSRSRPDS